MSPRKAVVEKYIEGFRRSDHSLVLSCLTDDVVWELHGYTTLQGRNAFDAEIENDAFIGSPSLTIDRLIEEGDTVVATGRGSATRKDGEILNFLFADVFTFSGDVISRLEIYQVNLDEAG
jgi:ketosteroid isomerase-like protein